MLLAFGSVFMFIALEFADESLACAGLTLFCLGVAEGCEWYYNRIGK